MSHQIDKSLWHTFSSFSFLHSSHMWIPTILWCRKHGSPMSTGFISRLRLCWRLRRFKINITENLTYLWKSNICSHKLDVQEANVSVSQCQKQKLSRLMLVCEWMVSLLLIYGMWWYKCYIHRITRNHQQRELETACMITAPSAHAKHQLERER